MRVVDTSAWIEWLRDSEVGRKVDSEIPVQEAWIVPTIVQYELARWLVRQVSRRSGGQHDRVFERVRGNAVGHDAGA